MGEEYTLQLFCNQSRFYGGYAGYSPEGYALYCVHEQLAEVFEVIKVPCPSAEASFRFCQEHE